MPAGACSPAIVPALVAPEPERDVGVAHGATRASMTSMHSSASQVESTYSQTGSRGLAW